MNILSDREIEESVLDEDEKYNVSGYVDADGNCSFNGSSAPSVSASYIAYVDGKEEVRGRPSGDKTVRKPKKKTDNRKTEEIVHTLPNGSRYVEYRAIESARISGDCCSLIGTAYHAKGGDVSNLRIHGDDVNIIIETVDGVTELSATFLGDDSYDVEELDDGANLFSFDVGDVVSGDDIRMPLIKLALEK